MSNQKTDDLTKPVDAGKLRQQGTNPTPSRVGNFHGDPASAGELTPEQVEEMIRNEKAGRS